MIRLDSLAMVETLVTWSIEPSLFTILVGPTSLACHSFHLAFFLGTILLTGKNAPLRILVFSRKVLHLYSNLGKKDLFGLSDNQGIRHLTQLRVDLNPLRFYKFSHNFLDTNSPMCLIHDGIGNCEHYLLDCGLHVLPRASLLSNVSLACGIDLTSLSRSRLTHILLFGDPIFSPATNRCILLETIRYINATGIYQEPHP